MSLRILIAPVSFNDSLRADQVADCIAAGMLRAMPAAQILKVPLFGDEEGFTRSLVKVTGGTLHEVAVTGSVGQRVEGMVGFLGGCTQRTAVVETATINGRRLPGADMYNPLLTTSYGMGSLIRVAMDAGAERILIGCGASDIYDGGAGLAQALGVAFYDGSGDSIGWGAAALTRIEQIDLQKLDPRLKEVQIDVACNLHQMLCGNDGVARRYRVNKGATKDTFANLEQGLENYARIIKRSLGWDVRLLPGGGASGGVAAGLYALLGARLHSRYQAVLQYLEFDKLLDQVDLVVTAEGSIDLQTARGKLPVEVAWRAKQHHLPVIALAGSIGQGAEINFQHGIDSFSSILDAPCSVDTANDNASFLLTAAAERAARMIMVGQMLPS